MIHSDRGHQYTSNEFKQKLDAAKMTHSMSRAGNCIDNRPMEGFWGILKCEKYYLHKYNTYEEIIMQLINILISTIPRDYKKD